MADQRTYLELSEDGGASHKFYEVTVEGTQLSIRYGRIGDSGQLKVSSFSTHDKALAEAQKKISGKTRKGYAPKGDVGPVMKCDSAVFSCAAVEDGKYVFAGDNMSSIYCFNERGERLWKLSTGCGSAFSMQFFKDRLYLVTTDGSLACVDASEAAIQAAQRGSVPKPVSIKAPQPLAAAQVGTVETTRSASVGVIVECYEQGGQVRVRVVSPGYNPHWHVQFPKDIREVGARFVVEGVHESSRGGFYRAYGDIQRLVS